MSEPIYDNVASHHAMGVPDDFADMATIDIDGGLDDVEYPEDVTTAGLFARARKAFVAGTFGLAGAAGPLVLAATSDGEVSLEYEVIPYAIISLGVGLSTFFATYGVKNAA